MTGSDQAWVSELGDHFGDFDDKSKIPENTNISISQIIRSRFFLIIPWTSRSVKTIYGPCLTAKSRSLTEWKRLGACSAVRAESR
ncbi:hypothetical protein AVEN_41231-1 [Araneus ventricosus]|uniref:Uncharacterized protein n=1 Tax=Araneus ventricosus TaxID=182803 RepID=A0A4Y2SMC0_ARAVE|nr:hypothetical protein AVEN_41231-1 [Araneus ventricosus]